MSVAQQDDSTTFWSKASRILFSDQNILEVGGIKHSYFFDKYGYVFGGYFGFVYSPHWNLEPLRFPDYLNYTRIIPKHDLGIQVGRAVGGANYLQNSNYFDDRTPVPDEKLTITYKMYWLGVSLPFYQGSRFSFRYSVNVARRTGWERRYRTTVPPFHPIITDFVYYDDIGASGSLKATLQLPADFQVSYQLWLATFPRRADKRTPRDMLTTEFWLGYKF